MVSSDTRRHEGCRSSVHARARVPFHGRHDGRAIDWGRQQRLLAPSKPFSCPSRLEQPMLRTMFRRTRPTDIKASSIKVGTNSGKRHSLARKHSTNPSRMRPDQTSVGNSRMERATRRHEAGAGPPDGSLRWVSAVSPIIMSGGCSMRWNSYKCSMIR